jgi:hypothetical protein
MITLINASPNLINICKSSPSPGTAGTAAVDDALESLAISTTE